MLLLLVLPAVLSLCTGGHVQAQEPASVPGVEKVAFTDGIARYKLNDIIEVTVTFSEVVAVTGTPQIDLTIGSMTRQADYQSGPPSTALVFRYTVMDTDEDTDDDGATVDANGLKLNGGSIKKHNTDIDADLTHEAHVEPKYINTVDGITPVLSTAAAYGDQLVLTYDDTLWPYSRTPASAYVVKVNNAVRGASTPLISHRFVTLTLASAVLPSDQVTVSYIVGEHPVRDEAGNQVAALVNQAVTTSAPYVSSLEISSSPAARRTYAGGEVIELRVTFSESVTVTGAPRLLLTFESTGPYERAAPYVSGSGTTVLVFKYTVAEGLDRFFVWALRLLGRWREELTVGDEDPDGLSIAVDALDLNDGTIRDSDNQDALLVLDELTDVGGHKVDGLWPQSDVLNDPYVVNGATLMLHYEEMLDENSVPAGDAFAVTAGGTMHAVTDVSIDDRTVTLTLDTPVGANDAVRLSYTAPTGTEAMPVQDLVGNDAQDFTDRLVRPPLGISVSFGADRYTVDEGQAVEVTVRLSADPERRVEIPLALTPGDNVEASDYTGVPHTVVFKSDEREQSFSFSALADQENEQSETVTIGFDASLPTGMEAGSPATTVVTIVQPPQQEGNGRDEGSSNTAPSGQPTIAGTEQVGETLTVDVSGITDPNGLTQASFRYEWVRVAGGSETTIAGATGSAYTVTAADVGSRLKVRVGFTDDNGTDEAVESALTGVVAAAPAPENGGSGGGGGGGRGSGGGGSSGGGSGGSGDGGSGGSGSSGGGGGSSAEPVGYLENPGDNSFQSGLGVISGWVCAADTVEIELNGVPRVAAYGTERLDTQGECGDTDNGFGLLFNWNLLGDGEHEVVAYADGIELGRVTVTVITLGAEFLRGVAGECVVADFPSAGESVRLVWQEAQQNFVLAEGAAPTGVTQSGTPGVGVLENPSPHSFQSGIGVLSGWVCEAEEVVITIGDLAPQVAGYGTERLDTLDVCGDTDNGFGLLFNWNLLGDGAHEVVASADGVELGRTTVRVTTLGEEFVRGAVGECVVADFPHPGETVTLTWQESSQNFVITDLE